MATNCLNDSGYRTGEEIRSTAVTVANALRNTVGVAIAFDNAQQLVRNYRRQRDIAHRAMVISEEQQKFMREVYWPRELQFLEEFAKPEDIEPVEQLGRRVGGRIAAALAGQFAKALAEAKCSMPRYCTSHNKKQMQDLLLARSMAIANARTLGRMIAFADYQARMNTNFERRKQAVAIGKGLMDEAANLYRSAGQGLAAVGSIYAQRVNNALQGIGFNMNRKVPPTPEMQAMWREAQTYGQGGQFARAPYQVGGGPGVGPASGYGRYPTTNGIDAMGLGQFGQTFNTDALTHAQYDSDMVGRGTMKASGGTGTMAWADTNNMGWQQNERWNEADVGNRNLAPKGKLFVHGGSGYVDLSEATLQFVDDKNPGDRNT